MVVLDESPWSYYSSFPLVAMLQKKAGTTVYIVLCNFISPTVQHSIRVSLSPARRRQRRDKSSKGKGQGPGCAWDPGRHATCKADTV